MENNQFDKIIGINIEDEMKKSYIDYAMSVIVSRALPDVRDGLKPVHRRILYSMNELNLDPSKSYRKSARIVGDTMGKYHPHGDSSIYQAMVRLAQDFSTRYMLVDGHGNFGSIDGDGAAAQRYTEAKLSKLSMEMLLDIDKNTVDFAPNFDESLKEPMVLPSRIPNILINGSSGIAVGMATNIPPHNLTEVVDAIIKIIDNKIFEQRDTDVEELIEIIKGPDFPTGATILGTSGIRSAYRTGRGKVIIRANAVIEVAENNRERIIVNEIPYQVNKSKLIEKIADLVKDKKIEGISDLRDETDRTGMRVVIELKRDANALVVLNNLYKYTQMQESFGIIMLALVDSKPAVLTLKDILIYYLNHQVEVVSRRIKFDLDRAKKRAHILEGLKIALKNIEEVIKIIRSSKDNNEAKIILIEKFNLSEEQATSIPDMRLRSLNSLEQGKIDSEYKDLIEKISNLQGFLQDEDKLYSLIKEEIIAIKNKYGDERRSKIELNPNEIEEEDLIEEEASVITMSHLNYIKRTPLATYRSQNRGGRGIIGMQTRDEDFVRDLYLTSTHDFILFFTSFGRVYKLKGYQIPEAGRVSRGTAIVNLLQLDAGEKINAIVPLRTFEENKFLVMITKRGTIKKTTLNSYSNIRKGGLVAINLKEDDILISAFITDGKKEIFVSTKDGKGIMFSEKDVRPMGRSTTGVRAINLKDKDFVVSANLIDQDSKVLNVTELGFGKRSDYSEFNLQFRGGKGVKIHHITEKTSDLVGTIMVNDNEQLMLINSEGIIIRLRGKDISTFGRVSQGVKLINLNDGVKVVSIAKIQESYIDLDEDIEEEDIVEQNTTV